MLYGQPEAGYNQNVAEPFIPAGNESGAAYGHLTDAARSKDSLLTAEC
ncbi:MAG: hypothetical protein NC318_07035 [Blautia sp.]|nr:hypothetical protein [Blautia sp.]